MARAQQLQKRKRRKTALPVVSGVAVVALAMTGSASAAANPTAPRAMARDAALSHEITIGEEEISDVSLSTFSLFDKENHLRTDDNVRVAARCGRCGRCGGAGRCAAARCAAVRKRKP